MPAIVENFRPDEELRGRLTRLVDSLCLTTIAASLLWAAPLAHRLALATHEPVASWWLGVAGLAVPGIFVVVMIYHGARATLRQRFPRQANWWRALSGLSVFCITLAMPLLVFGTVLKTATHHRGLGGTTFGVIALGMTLATALFAHRLTQFARKLSSNAYVASVLSLVAAALVFVGIGGKAWVLTSFGTATALAPEAIAVLDLLFLQAVCVVTLCLIAIKKGRPVAVSTCVVEVVVVFALVFAGRTSVERARGSMAAVRTSALVIAPVIDLLSGAPSEAPLATDAHN